MFCLLNIHMIHTNELNINEIFKCMKGIDKKKRNIDKQNKNILIIIKKNK